jgi:sugar lactone lactonase YvrE
VGWATGLGVPVLTALLAPRTWVEWEPALRAAAPAAVRSVGYAGLAATVVVVVALGTVRWRWMVGAGVLFVVPGVFTGMVLAGVPAGAWLDGVRDAGGMVVSGLVLRGLFPGWWVARRLWEGSGAGLRETVRLAGGGRWAEWRHGVLAGDVWRLGGVWYVVYLLGLWDVETQILVVPPGGDTLALMIFNLLHYGHNAQVTALCVLLGGVALVPGAAIVALRWLWRVGGRRLLGSGLGGLLVLGASGCGRGDGDGDGDGAGLRSALFERAEVIGGRGTGPGFFSKPRSVAVDEAGLLYVVDMTGRVQRFGAGGQWEAAWQMPDTARGRAKGMDAAAGGGVWVVEPHYHRVTRYGPDGAVAVQWGERGLEPGRLWFPRAIAAGGDGTCWVTEYGRVERVQRFRMDTGELVGGFGEAGTEPGRLNRAEGLAIGPGGDVYVADSCNHRIQVFSADGRLLRMHGRAGRGIGEFSYPYDVRLDAEGRQYVCEFGNSRIQVFGPDDRPLEVLGGPGTGPTQLNNPWSLCLDKAGNLYVADSLNHRVVRYVRRRGGGGRV